MNVSAAAMFPAALLLRRARATATTASACVCVCMCYSQHHDRKYYRVTPIISASSVARHFCRV